MSPAKISRNSHKISSQKGKVPNNEMCYP